MRHLKGQRQREIGEVAPAPRSMALRCAPGSPASRSGCREPSAAAKRAPGRGVGAEGARAGPIRPRDHVDHAAAPRWGGEH